MPQLPESIDATLMDCADAFTEFNSQMGMLLNQDYLTEELLNDLVDAVLMSAGPVGENQSKIYLTDVIELYSQKHAADGEYAQANNSIRELAQAVFNAALLLPGYQDNEPLPFKVDSIKAGMVFLKRVA